MNALEQLNNIIEKGDAEFRPFTFVSSLYGRRFTGATPEEHYNNPLLYLKGQSAVYNTFKPNILFAPFCYSIFGEAFGSTVKYLERQAPNIKQYAASSTEELLKLSLPDVDNHPRIKYIRSSIRLMAEKYGNKLPIAAMTLSPFDLPLMIMGMDAWMDTVLFRPTDVEKVVNYLNPFYQKLTEAFINDGASLLVMSTPFLTSTIASRELCTSFIKYYEEAFSSTKANMIIHHGGSKIVPYMDLFKFTDNVIAYVIRNDESIVEAREKLGGKPLIFSGPDILTCLRDSCAKINFECSNIFRAVEKDKRIGIMNSGLDIDPYTPHENLFALSKYFSCK